MDKELLISKGRTMLSTLKKTETRQIIIVAMTPLILLAMYIVLPKYLREGDEESHSAILQDVVDATNAEADKIEADDTAGSQGSEQNKLKIKVDVGGAVVNPGLLVMEPGARVADAIDLAGGLSENADQLYISQALNLAQKLYDGDKLYLPTYYDVSVGLPAPAQLTNRVGDPLPVLATSSKKDRDSQQSQPDGQIDNDESGDNSASTGLVNINTASKTELDGLPGIGEKYAEYIIDHRPYSSKTDICSEEVIKNSTTCEAIQSLITL